MLAPASLHVHRAQIVVYESFGVKHAWKRDGAYAVVLQQSGVAAIVNCHSLRAHKRDKFVTETVFDVRY